MAASLPSKARSLTVKRNSILVASVRTKSIKINGSEIDITTDDDAGWKKLLVEPAIVSAEISVAGILKDETLATEAVNTTTRALTTEFGWPGASTPGKLAGTFFLTSFHITGEYQGAATFEATFVSSGAVTITAAV